MKTFTCRRPRTSEFCEVPIDRALTVREALDLVMIGTRAFILAPLYEADANENNPRERPIEIHPEDLRAYLEGRDGDDSTLLSLDGLGRMILAPR